MKHLPTMRFFDIGDRARLPWRFFGAARAILARAALMPAAAAQAGRPRAA